MSARSLPKVLTVVAGVLSVALVLAVAGLDLGASNADWTLRSVAAPGSSAPMAAVQANVLASSARAQTVNGWAHAGALLGGALVAVVAARRMLRPAFARPLLASIAPLRI